MNLELWKIAELEQERVFDTDTMNYPGRGGR